MIEIDGNYGVGSGQLTRYALAFSSLTKTPVHITNIRAKRPQPGLKLQHLTSVNCLKQICNANVTGNKLGSSNLEFTPGILKSGTVRENIGTAGSISLLLQNLIYPCMFAKEKTNLEITGGTDVLMSPTIDYIDKVFFPFLKPYVKKLELETLKRGFFPKGGGRVKLYVQPKYSVSEFKDFNSFLDYIRDNEELINLTERGELVSFNGVSAASKYLEKADVARRQTHGASRELSDYSVKFENVYSDSLSPGSSITLFAEFENSRIGADQLGEKGKKAEVVGEECARKLKYELDSNGCVDLNMVDNLIPLLAILKGSITSSKITDHAKTAMWICEKFLNVKFDHRNNTVICV